MNTYFLTEQQEMFRKTVREFAEREIEPCVEELNKPNQTVWKKLMKKTGDSGLLGVTMPKEYGGLGLDTVSHMIALEELTKVSPGFCQCIQGHAGLASILIRLAGSSEQKKKWLIPAVKGEKICSFALTEKEAGSDSANIKTYAVLENGKWILNGQKKWITNCTGDFFTVAARTDFDVKPSRGISMFIVPADTPGITISKPYRKVGCITSPCATIDFNEVAIPEENLIGELNSGFKLMMKSLDIGRLGIAGCSIGIAQEAYEIARKYSKERVQFGKIIGEQPVIGNYLAEMAMEIDIARTMLYRVCRLRDEGMPYSSEAAAIKIFASEMSVKVAEKAMQILGGNGYCEDYKVGMLWRDSKLMTIGEGTTEILKMVLSRACLKDAY